MTDDPLERLLQGYRPPEVPPRLDRRILEDVDRILLRARMRRSSAQFVRPALDALGFGYLSWVYDFVQATDAEYRIELL